MFKKLMAIGPMLLLVLEPTVTAIDRAISELQALRATLVPGDQARSDDDAVEGDEGGGGPAVVVTSVAHDVVTIYRRLDAVSRSRELLEVLPGGATNGLTPTELGKAMAPDDRTRKPLSRGSVRAVIRNLQKGEAHALGLGLISEGVLGINFDDYDKDGAGRYYLKNDARAALDGYLAETATS